MLENRVKLGGYHYFTIYDPKERMICAADFRERVIQHAVANICNETFEKYQIYDSYASRKGKGVDSCLKRTLEFCKKYKWYLKLDIHKFYDSIHHKILLHILNKRFKDNLLLKFFSDLIDTYQVSNDRGIPIGNLLSQYFANMYLAVLDHEIKERIRVKGYLRYMDDFLCFSNDKYFLIQVQNRIENFVDNILLLCLNKPQLNKCCYGIPFLSYRVYPNGLRLSLKAKRRFKLKIKEANKTENPDKALALLAFVNRADSLAFRKKVFKETGL